MKISGGCRELSLEYQTKELGFGMKGKVGLEPFQRGKVMLNLVPGEECLTRRPDISRGTLFQVVQESRSKPHSCQMLEAGANVEEKKPEHHAEGGSAGLGVHEAQGGRGEKSEQGSLFVWSSVLLPPLDKHRRPYGQRLGRQCKRPRQRQKQIYSCIDEFNSSV